MALTKYNYNSFDLTTAASKGLSFNSDADGFTTGSPDSMTLIKTLTASSSATLSFVDGSSSVVLDNTYPVYLFKFINCHPASDDQSFLFNMSADTGSNYNVAKTTTSFQANHNEGDSATEFAYDTSRDLGQGTGFAYISHNCGSDNDQAMSGEMYLFNPSSTTFVKHFMSKVNYQSISANPYIIDTFVAGYVNTTTALTRVQFKFDSGTIDSGTIKMYGVL